MGTERGKVDLTKAALKDLMPEPKDFFVSVNGYRGLTIRVLPDGSKAYVLRYRFHGIQKRSTLGTWPQMSPDEAKAAYHKAWSKLNGGVELNQEKVEQRKAAVAAKQAAFTVADLADRYITEHIEAVNKASWAAEAKRLIQKHVLPALGKVPLKDVGPADISTLLFKMKKATPTQANRTRAVLRTMFGRAEEWELRPLGSNPVAVVKQRAPEIKRERRLSDVELKTLGAVLRESKESAYVLAAVRLALLAGMRKGEIQGLRWEWVNLEAGELRIPPEQHKTGAKTGKARVVHLCAPMVATLKALPQNLGCPFVIPGQPRYEGKGKSKKLLSWGPFIGLQSPWERIRVAAKLAVDGEPEDADPGWHDLRRTFASVGADLGLKGFVGELLGHSEQTVTDIYTRTGAQRLKDAAESIGGRIDGILSGTIDPEKEASDTKNGLIAK